MFVLIQKESLGAMKKTKLTRSLMAACSIVALSAVMYGCAHSGDDPVAEPPPMDMDMDGDGVADADDAFPNDPTETADSDDDGVGDNADAFPMDAMETADSDGDGVGDNADLDDDNDGVADVHDGLPLNPMETADSDGDGVGDNADLDDDGDGVLDADDAFPLDGTETADADGDGVGDNADPDRDGDGVANADDAFPMVATETVDSDGDGVGDNADPDRDGDGVANANDAFPNDATETVDSDGDGVGDNADLDRDGDGVANADDAFPMDPMETADSDMDGVGDNAVTDRDGDGVADADDAFPDDAMETADADMDGVGDVADLDDDNDGVADADDAFPNDAMETADADMDGVGDVADLDDDNDGVADADDAFPNDAMETADTDGDGVGDNADTDRDGDGVANVADDFPDNSAETRDSDGDGVGNNADDFPFNRNETADTDGDGVGDNADAFPLNAMETADSDGDGVGDNADAFPGHSDQQGVRLFQAANAYHVIDLEGTMADEKAAHVTSVGGAMATIAVAGDGNQAAGTTANAAWVADTLDDPATMDVNEFMAGSFMVSVGPGGESAIPFELRASRDATDLNDDGDTEDDGEDSIINTAMKIDDLGAFQGYDIRENDGDAENIMDAGRVIAFTNKQQGTHATAAVLAVTGKSLANAAASSGTVTVLGSPSDGNYTGVTFFEAGADTEDPGFGFSGGLTCAAGAACTATTNADGTITVTGYTFTGTRTARAGSIASGNTENNDYLLFGLWLDVAQNGEDTFGAFADGGTDYDAEVQNAVTGTASYSGKAAGAHHKTGMGVNWFGGDASLTANFGTDAAPGTISGEISNIRVNGGGAMSDPIYLGQANLISGDADFNGAAFMGAETAPGAPTHEFDGTWSGTFFGGTVNDPDTTEEDESVTAPLAAAGTFGVTKSEGMGDDMVVESFVGAFGAHKDE